MARLRQPALPHHDSLGSLVEAVRARCYVCTALAEAAALEGVVGVDAEVAEGGGSAAPATTYHLRRRSKLQGGGFFFQVVLAERAVRKPAEDGLAVRSVGFEVQDCQ